MRTKVVAAVIAVAAIGLGPAVVEAALINPFNARPVVINPAYPGEIPVQTMVNTILGPGLNVNTDQSTAGMWATATFPPSTIPTLAFEQTSGAPSQAFGIWFGTDSASIFAVDLLLGPAVQGTTAAISWSGPGYTTLDVGSTVGADCGGKVKCGSFTSPLVTPTSFGFFLRTGSGDTYYSADALNGGEARMVAFHKTTNWAIAFEDGTDFDYQDMVVKVESIAPVPEPGTLLLLGAGISALALGRRRKG